MYGRNNKLAAKKKYLHGKIRVRFLSARIDVVFDSLSPRKISWHWYAALILFLSASVGFTSGVGLTGQPDIVDAPFVVKAYYSMGLFVVGGLDIGTPVGGPAIRTNIAVDSIFRVPITRCIGGH